MADTTAADAGAPFALPRVTIKFCTQCKWNLRAAYFAQELLSTFSTSLGEVALQPSTGGTFIVEIFHIPSSSTPASSSSTSPIPSHPHIASTILWDRKTDGGFPETKELKRRVRDVIEPERNLGHVDRDHAKPPSSSSASGGKQDPSSRQKDLEVAASTAGAGGAGTNEAAAVLVGHLQGTTKKESGAGKKEVCEDC